MKYLLDTNVVIVYLKGRSLPLKLKIQTINPIDIAVSSIVKAELFAGSAKSQDPIKSRQKQEIFLSRFFSLPFDDETAQVYGLLRANLEKQGKPIGPMDMLIAATAIRWNLTLITHNISEFQFIEGLLIEDWEA